MREVSVAIPSRTKSRAFMEHDTFEVIKGPADVTFETQLPLYCPYDNVPRQGPSFGLPFYQEDAFEWSPFTLPAIAGSGSPLLTGADGLFLAFRNYTALEQSRFRHDGFGNVTAFVPQGQELLVARGGTPDDHWREYNRIVMSSIGYERIADHPAFWALPEYCTWVEQKYLAGSGAPYTVLSHAMVERFVQQIDEYGYPPGKVTLDHGWAVDPRTAGFGDWTVDEERFPSLAATADLIAARGHVPGIWLGLAKIHPESNLARNYPGFVGKPELFLWTKRSGKAVPSNSTMHYLNPDAPLESFFTDLFERFFRMGFRKYKIDMSYHEKHDMITLARKFYAAAKSVDPDCEIECHLPDIFGARWTDVVRTNDIWCVPYKPWYESTRARYECCYRSAPGRLINRDHIGGNHPAVTEHDFLTHLRTFTDGVGYPLVSLLPHHISERAVRAVGDYLGAYVSDPRAVSDF